MKMQIKFVVSIFFILLIAIGTPFSKVQAEGNAPDDQEKIPFDLKSLIESIEGSTVQYSGKDRTGYNRFIRVDRYNGRQFYYLVDPTSSQIIEVMPIPEVSFEVDTTQKYTEQELEQKAREFVTKAASDLVLAELTPAFGNKNGLTYFFRWEDKNKKLEGVQPAFIQVGFSAGGDFLNYVNTLPIASEEESNDGVNDVSDFTDFNEVYANGGSYWTKEYGSLQTNENAGYCYIYGWCNPKNFYFAPITTGQSSTVKGKWAPNDNLYTMVSAFVPSTHATTNQAAYMINNQWERAINQQNYYDTWVSLQSSPFVMEYQVYNSEM